MKKSIVWTIEAADLNGLEGSVKGSRRAKEKWLLTYGEHLGFGGFITALAFR